MGLHETIGQELWAECGVGFAVPAEHISVLDTPTEYRHTLQRLAQEATQRVCISSLYLGTGEHDHELVSALRKGAAASPDMRVDILLDGLRGTRGSQRDVDSVSVLRPLLEEHPNASLSLFRTPLLRGLLKALPERANEVVGVHHMKVYVFDDTVMFSGANMADSYFTCRQDRYIVVRDRAVADYFDGLCATLREYSYTVSAHDGDTLHAHPRKLANVHNRPDPQEQPQQFIDQLSNSLRHFLHSHHTPSPQRLDQHDTWLFPSVQYGVCGITQDDDVLNTLLSFRASQPEGQQGRLDVASGYLNITPEHVDTLLSRSDAVRVVTAAPVANGFYKASGLAGCIPDMFSYFAKRLLQRAEKAQRQSFSLFEYERSDWTFHAKGLWYSAPGQDEPCLTWIGSPNFGARSQYRDTEASVVLLSGNPSLQGALRRERDGIFRHCSPLTLQHFQRQTRRLPFYIPILSRVCRNML